MKHTPGPWKYDGAGCIEGNGKVIADVRWDMKMSITEGHANLTLMAAAPDLIEALTQLKKWVGKLSDWRGEDPPFEIVDAAIKKAGILK